MADFGKRALNKAQTKLNILQAMQDLIIDTNFRDLKVKDIAARANVTEMTFFNYFKVKDDLMIYFMQIWTLDIMTVQLQDPLKGEEAIRRIFSFIAKQITGTPRIMLNLISYLASLSHYPQRTALQAAECYLRHPEQTQLHVEILPNLGAIFLEHLHEIKPNFDHQMNLARLFSCFYGDALIAHITQQDLQLFYTDTLNLIFKDIK